MMKTLETESNESLTIPNTINKQINKLMTPPCDLLTWKDMPEHLQFNPYVHTGTQKLRPQDNDASTDELQLYRLQAIDHSKVSKDAWTVCSICTTRPLTF